jgi:hypothetical protein
MFIKKAMTRLTSIFLLLAFATTCFAQKQKQNPNTEIRPTFTKEKWTHRSGKVEFLGTSMKVAGDAGKVILKDIQFANGTIEFDATPLNAANSFFVGIYFRHRDSLESECVYLRVGKKNSLKENDAIQYAPVLQGNLIWDVMGHYQGPARIYNDKPNHMKLVIAGNQMKVYVNDLKTPSLEIPILEGNTRTGSIALEGYVEFANLVIKPNATEGLSFARGADLTNHDANYIRKWNVSEPQPFADGKELGGEHLPTDKTVWDTISAERRGFINLSRRYGFDRSGRRMVWLKMKIVSEKEHKNKLELGFSDDVWVVINGRLLYMDKNMYQHPIRKYPAGRISIENTSFDLPLKQGDNELLICITNDFYGWGIIARLRSLEGIDFDL